MCFGIDKIFVLKNLQSPEIFIYQKGSRQEWVKLFFSQYPVDGITVVLVVKSSAITFSYDIRFM